jgi:hypothetical protein
MTLSLLPSRSIDRRSLVLGVGATALIGLPTDPAAAQVIIEDPGRLDRAINAFTGGAAIADQRVVLTLPTLAENGNVVPLQIVVESPMTATDHVRRITVSLALAQGARGSRPTSVLPSRRKSPRSPRPATDGFGARVSRSS